jgi:hypothetical protein
VVEQLAELRRKGENSFTATAKWLRRNFSSQSKTRGW